MPMPDWVIPWLITALAIWPLRQVERWIHKHIQGLGLLITNDPTAAVLIYYLILLPGVILHEFSQFVLAKILLVKVKKFRLWPEQQKGLIRLGLVEIEKNTDTIRTTMIGIIPMVTGIIVIGIIASTRFDFAILSSSFSTGDLRTISQGVGEFLNARDFWLWLYLIFAIANAMLPEPHDEINWWMILGALAGITAFLLLLDLGILLNAALEGPLAEVGEWMSFSLGIALILDIACMGLISASEAIFSRILNRELDYQ